ncbi:hypothetical protein ACBI99_44800 [Nonomuraea sp. ATR24]|uniref:hypothetical protein n=1 Tax=Nonomuraea sp. ATR24 TaxID=1676744 RepID=UPI0035BECEEB
MSAGWTVREAVDQLAPEMDEAEVRALLLLFQIPVQGQRRGQGPGRPVPEYDQPAILRAHAAVIAHRRGLLHAMLGPRPAAG